MTRRVLLKTVIAPGFELPRVTPPTSAEIPGLQGLVLDMKILSGLADSELAKALTPLVSAYADWIEGLEAQLKQDSSGLEPYTNYRAANHRHLQAKPETHSGWD